MKAAPIHRAFEAVGIPHQLLHTGQHYDRAMSQLFFEDLGMPKPAVNLGVGSGSHARQTGAVMSGLEEYFARETPRAIVVVGDINSTMAGAIVAAKAGIPCIHVEAGLRSRDRSMPEEINRIVTDALCDLLLTTSNDASENLLKEGRADSDIELVGNVMIDTLLHNLQRARALRIGASFGLRVGHYSVLTLHRPSNVDDPTVLKRLLSVAAESASEMPLVFPIHPRTRARIKEFNLDSILNHASIHVTEPLGYLEFLSLTSGARLILTDSGGLQEESSVLGIPCLTLRENTERPVTITHGTNRLVGSDAKEIRSGFRSALTTQTKECRPPLWDGKAATRIVRSICERFKIEP